MVLILFSSVCISSVKSGQSANIENKNHIIAANKAHLFILFFTVSFETSIKGANTEHQTVVFNSDLFLTKLYFIYKLKSMDLKETYETHNC